MNTISAGAACEMQCSLMGLWEILSSSYFSVFFFFAKWQFDNSSVPHIHTYIGLSFPNFTGPLWCYLWASLLLNKFVDGFFCDNKSSDSLLLDRFFPYKRYGTLIRSTSIVWCATRESQQSSIMFSESMFCVHLQSLVVVGYLWNERHTFSGNWGKRQRNKNRAVTHELWSRED